jgi:hypothetical protein
LGQIKHLLRCPYCASLKVHLLLRHFLGAGHLQSKLKDFFLHHFVYGFPPLTFREFFYVFDVAFDVHGECVGLLGLQTRAFFLNWRFASADRRTCLLFDCALCFTVLHYFFPFFHDMRFELVFFLAELLHFALVGRHAGYDLRFSPFLRPQGFPVLQSIQPSPPFWANQVRRLFSFATFVPPVLCANLAAFGDCA